jgi:hypothetical protein
VVADGKAFAGAFIAISANCDTPPFEFAEVACLNYRFPRNEGARPSKRRLLVKAF